MHRDRDELREVNKSIGTRKKIWDGKGWERCESLFRSDALLREMSVGIGVTVGKLRHGGCQTVSRLLLSLPGKMLVVCLVLI